MICPNCGKNTSKKERCEHCGKPTEFARRSNLYSNPVPCSEPPIKKKEGTNRIIGWVLMITAILTTVGVWMIVFRLYMKQPQPAEETIVSQTETWDTGATEYITQPEETSAETVPEETLEKETTEESAEATTEATTLGAYVIRFYKNGPQQIYEVEPPLTEIAVNEEIPTLENEEGYIFCGWNTDPSGNGKYYEAGVPFADLLESDLDLYGQWEEDAWDDGEDKEDGCG